MATVDAKQQPRRPALHGAAEWVSWTWEMINGGYSDITWSADGKEVNVHNPERLAREVLPQYYRHTQYSSFVRALNAYQFKKVRPGAWINPNFQQGKPELLKNITRKVKAEKPKQPEAATPTTWELLQEERARIAWMKEEMLSLEAQLKQVQSDEWQQRVEAVRLGQFVASELRAFAPGPIDTQLAKLAAPLLEAPGGVPHPNAECPRPGDCKHTDMVCKNCNGCHETALELRRLCIDFMKTGSDHERIVEELGGVDLLASDLAKGLDGAELDELAAGLDLAALESEGEALGGDAPAAPMATA